ncbi:MAG: SDR family oxidoreductase [Alphaproteobacteria bacterium]|nr:SDR family oxidoreductase [Alphaproteobacteria bacterium]
MIKTALITGAAKRIGKEIALSLAKDGWDIAIHYNSSDGEAMALAAEIKSMGQKAALIKADLSYKNEIERVIPEANQKLGQIGCLINNASVFKDDGIKDVTWDSWETHLATNLSAPMFLMHKFVEQMSTGNGKECYNGVIINMLDQRVLNLTPRFMSYTVSRVALWTLTQTLAQSLAPFIRVNGIALGPVVRAARQTEEHFNARCKSSPLQKNVSMEEICESVKLVINSPSMTGNLIVLDSGMHLGWEQSNKLI